MEDTATTWAFDFPSRAWTWLDVQLPVSRSQAAAAYDSVNDVMILFGGDRGGLDFTNETWSFQITCAEGVVARNAVGNEYQCRSVQEAVDMSGDGWMIEAGSGTYDELVMVYEKSNLIIETKCDAAVKGFKLQKSENITINGFEIDAEGTSASGVFLMGGNNDNSYITITNCNIHNADNNYSRIKAARGNPNTSKVDNYIHHNGRNGIMFIDATGGPHFISQNIIQDNGWNGMKVARYGVLRERTSGNPWPEGITLIDNITVNNNGKILIEKCSLDLG